MKREQSGQEEPKPKGNRAGWILVGVAGLAAIGLGIEMKMSQDNVAATADRQKSTPGTPEYAYSRYYQEYANPYPGANLDTQQAKCLSATEYAQGYRPSTGAGPARPANEVYDQANDVLTLTPTYGQQGALVLKLTGFKAGGQLAPADLASEQILDKHNCAHAPLVEPGN